MTDSLQAPPPRTRLRTSRAGFEPVRDRREALCSSPLFSLGVFIVFYSLLVVFAFSSNKLSSIFDDTKKYQQEIADSQRHNHYHQITHNTVPLNITLRCIKRGVRSWDKR